MPILSSRGAGSAKGFGLTSGRVKLQTYSADFLVIAGGAGGDLGGGGGAGGYRTSTQTITGSKVITVTVGDGGPFGNPNGAAGAPDTEKV